MKAMLYAEWILLKQTIRTIGAMLLFFSVVTVITGQTSFAAMILLMFSVMFPSTLFTSEQAYGWHHLRLSMPVLRRDIVLSRFLISLFANGGMFLLSCVLFSICYKVSDAPINLRDEISSLLLCEAIALVIAGTLIMVAFKWGIAKARYIMMAGIWGPIALILILQKMGASGSWISLPEPSIGTIIALVFVGLLIYFGCYLISMFLYQKTEF